MSTKPKKILIFSLAYHPRVGGAEVAVKEITDRIADIEFHMVTARFSHGDAAEERVGRVQVRRVGGGSYWSKILFAPRAALAARRLHREHHFDAPWAMMSYTLFPIVLARLSGTRIPYVLTLQEGDTYLHMFSRLRVLFFLPLLRYGFRKAAAVSALSVYLAGWARRMGYEGEVAVVPNGADVQKFSGAKIPHEGTVLVTSSRLVHKKPVEDIVRGHPLLPESVRLVVAGIGPDEAMLKTLALELGVAARITWLGYVDHARLPAVLHGGDIFIRPSRSEGFGASFAEAMAAELPIVATQEGGITDFLFDAKRNPDKETTGWAVDCDSPEQIAAAVRDILAHPEQVVRVTETARKLAFEKYNWDSIAQDMREKIFARAL